MIEARDMQSPPQAAHNFRAILEAFSKPGRVLKLPQVSDCPSRLHAASAGIALALCDYQTHIWLSQEIDSPELRNFLRFHTGAPITSNADDAAFALVQCGEFARFIPYISKGTDEYPDTSATVIVQTTSFTSQQRVKLEGPGIAGDATLEVAGFGSSEWNLLADDRILFPLGVDVAFTTGDMLVAVPRSTRITCLEKC